MIVERIVNVRCFGLNGQEKWSIKKHNRFTLEGLTDQTTQTYQGVTYTPPIFYVGLGTNASGVLGGDNTAAKITTSAPSPPTTNNWAEITDYTPARAAITWDAPSIDLINEWAVITFSTVTFTMHSSGTLDCIFFVTASGIGTTTGVLSGVMAEDGAGFADGYTVEVSGLQTYKPI